MPKIKLNTGKLVGYMRTDLTEDRHSQAWDGQTRLQAAPRAGRHSNNEEAARHA